MKKFKIFLLAAIAWIFLASCEKNETVAVLDSDQKTDKVLQSIDSKPQPTWDMEDLPPSSIDLIQYEKQDRKLQMRSAPCVENVSPPTFSSTLGPGDSTSDPVTTCLDGVPPKGDVLFMMDLTGSMGGVLNTVKTEAINIMNGIDAVIDDSQFGLISHMDYFEYYTSCGYSSTYGSASSGDYPYALDQSVTETTADVSAAISSLTLGYGFDFPESYERALYETYSDPLIGWRPGAAKIVVAFLDALPHDCELGTGDDPGRDEDISTSGDNIDMDAVVAEMAAKNIKLIVVVANDGPLDVWQNYAESTGGRAFNLGAGDIVTQIADQIEQTVSTVNSLTMEASPGYASWVSAIDPPSYGPLELVEAQSQDFDITITVPDGATEGVHVFDINLIGDGIVYGTQEVTITVVIDSDGDGCNDDVDPHPDSNTDDTVVIDGCDSEVPNLFVTPDGCSTMADLIADCAASAENHGDFMSCLNALTNAWVGSDLITGAQKGRITSCAAQASIP